MSGGRVKWHRRRRTEQNARVENKEKNPLAVLRSKVVERDPPPRIVALTDSRGQPISLPKLRFMEDAP
jgi:hypothetical protein